MQCSLVDKKWNEIVIFLERTVFCLSLSLSRSLQMELEMENVTVGDL